MVNMYTITFSKQGEELVISVEDDGQGLNLKQIQQRLSDTIGAEVFDWSDEEVMAQLMTQSVSTSETVNHVSGRGVGLVAVKELVDSLDGDVKIISVAGKGTMVTITAPLHRDALGIEA